jgi:glycosyltransferase involved in cell wall biosynthesis
VLTPYPPSVGAVATFSASLCKALSAHGVDVSVVRVADGRPSPEGEVVGEITDGSADSVQVCTEMLNRSDVAIIQFDNGVYGGVEGDGVLGIIDELRVPAIATLHTILEAPTRHQRSIVESIAVRVEQVIVTSEVAKQRLCSHYDVDRRKVTTIPHGAFVPSGHALKRPSRPTILTWGLLRPGKGVERVIEAMRSLGDLPGRPRYLVVGPTHPDVLAEDGEAYRDALAEQARRGGVADSVLLDGRYFGAESLTALIQSAAVVVLPYDSADQAASGALVDAIASGRPVVATAFPHAFELLRDGAGIIVDHDDADGLEAALRSVLTQPRLAGSMAAEARRLAPEMAWPVVAGAYLRLAKRLVAVPASRFNR